MGASDPGGIRKSEELLTALLEAASQAILCVDQRGRIVLANQRTEELFGYERDELLGARIELLLPDSKRSTHSQHRDAFFERPRTRPMGIGMDLSGRRKDGKEFPVEVSLSYVEVEQSVFAIAFVTDISQRKQLEEQLAHSQKMEAVGRLAGGVAHDFNNMLTVITGYDRMILSELSRHDPLRGYAEQILQAAERASGLTNQLLAFSRRQIIRPRVVNVNTVVLQTERMLRRLIGEDIELRLALGEDAGNMRVDPGQVEQAIVNLSVNSRDAMPKGGILTIETSNTHLDETYAKTHSGVVPGDFVMIAVSDSGHGMDAETRRHIFEPFFTTKERGKGTGLGLATVYGAVKQSGGDVWVYSEPGRGTTFKLYFPRVLEAEAEPASGEVERPLRRAQGTILVVEDEDSVRTLTVLLLTQLGYAILSAPDPLEAIRISESHEGEIHVLLSDVVMPNLSGPSWQRFSRKCGRQ